MPGPRIGPGQRRRIRSMPALPLLAAGAKITMLGDSIIQNGNIATASTIENQGDSEIAWARMAVPRFKHAIWYDTTATGANLAPAYAEACAVDPLFRGGNLGCSGDTTTGMNRRLAQALSTDADIILYSGGTNVGNADTAIATVTANIAAAAAAISAAGKKMILGTIRPRRVSLAPAGSQISPATMDRIIQINTWIRANYAALGATLWDPWEALRDRTYNPGDPLYGTDAPGMTRDNVHLTPLGAYTSALSGNYGAVPLSTAIIQLIGSGFYFDANAGQLLLNPNFTGTGGTVGAGCTGQMPASTTIQNASGAGQPVTCIAALESNPDTGGQTIILTLTSTGAGAANTFNTIRLSAANPASGFASTDYVSQFYAIDISTPNPALVCYQATLGQGSAISARGLGQTNAAYNTEPYPVLPGIGWIQTEPLLVGARTSLNPRLDLIMRQDLAGTAVIRIKQGPMLKMPNPQTEFPWLP